MSQLSEESEETSIVRAILNACDAEDSTEALRLVNANPDVDYLSALNANGNTALMCALDYDMPDVAMKIFKNGKSHPEHINNNGDTALMYACGLGNSMRTYNKLAMEMLHDGNCIPEQVNNDGQTALIMACINFMSDIAMAIIETGKSRPEQVERFENHTALIITCAHNMPDVALALIATEQSRPEHVDNDSNTALIVACSKQNMSKVALALIATGQSRPEQVDEDSNTALIYACSKRDKYMPDVALALIATGQSRPEHVDNNSNTALMFACHYKQYNVAMAIVVTGKGNLKQKDSTNKSALDYLCNAYENTNVKSKEIVDLIRVICDKLGPSSPLYDNPNVRKVLSDINYQVNRSNQKAESMTKLYAMPLASTTMNRRERITGKPLSVPENMQAYAAVTGNPDLSRHIFSYLKHPTIKTKTEITENSRIDDPFSGGRRRKRRTTTRKRRTTTRKRRTTTRKRRTTTRKRRQSQRK